MDAPRNSRYDDRNEDIPMYSRLFIVCGRSVEEEDIKEAFTEFGEIEDVRIPRDRNTGERKGVAFVKFAKASQAAKALESLNHKCIGNCTRPIRVMVAANRSEIQGEDNNKLYRRIFIQVSRSPNDETEKDLYDYFSQYGYVDDVLIQTDRNTGQRKGFAYIRFRKFSEAAVAIEECDKKYRAIFAQPQGNQRVETPFENNINTLAASASQKTSLVSMMNVQPRGFTSVQFLCNPYLTHPYVEALFDIVPGMVQCQYFVDLVKNVGKGTVQYANPISAAYAVEKLNEFEYPPGHCVYVRPGGSRSENSVQLNIPSTFKKLKNAITSNQNSGAPDLAKLSEAIAEASKLVQLATGGVPGDSLPDSNDLNYCSVTLPPTQPLADIDGKVEKRLFLVCKPQPPPLTVLRDVFCRFGNLINVYTLPNKTVGYARYASTQSADAAMKTLHGAEICGVRIKVLEADEEAPPKRMKYDR
ncbi:RNA-binding protein 45-like [Aricia agestis]|uniref:RNA-binding protein 45-like n=1 Tax=Aricia agestis TaxID=91739 RepID=UPI001C20B72A|nr:RNA-binding protein 45-like [Aricia agestis]